MTTTKEGTSASVTEPSRGTAKPEAEAAKMVVLKVKGKRRYSKQLKPVQKLERGISKVNRRLARSISAGIKTWSKERDKSARKRRDGALRDLFPNSLRAASKTIRVAARATDDFLDEVNLRFKRGRFQLFPWVRF